MPNPHIYADEMAALDAASNDGQPARDAQHFRRIVAARNWVALAQAELVAAASAARGAGDSWTVIGAALGTTRQGAQRKIGRARSLGNGDAVSPQVPRSLAGSVGSRPPHAIRARR